ncbi:VOC family protein [Kocuria rhizophila]|uniref:VOC family protein n=1 Tax=Kocuria rhizophila TaxID=72000 RepID=UPI0036F20733
MPCGLARPTPSRPRPGVQARSVSTSPEAPQVIDGQYQHWCNLGVTIVQEPHDDVFGRTFIAQDPDGNLLRVAPVDPA